MTVLGCLERVPPPEALLELSRGVTPCEDLLLIALVALDLPTLTPLTFTPLVLNVPLRARPMVPMVGTGRCDIVGDGVLVRPTPPWDVKSLSMDPRGVRGVQVLILFLIRLGLVI